MGQKSIYKHSILATVILFTVVDICQPCIILIEGHGWKQKNVSERARLAKVVFLGKTIRRYPTQTFDNKAYYAADFKIIRLLKGREIIKEVLETHASRYVKVYGFGEMLKCLVDVHPGQTYIVFMVYHNSTRSLVARYDDAFGATAPATNENEKEILAELGWKPWSPWKKCSQKCGNGLQFRRRQCTRRSCEGEPQEMRRCNMYDCYGIKDIVNIFLKQKALFELNNIHEQVTTLPNPLKELEVHNGKTFSAPSSSIFQSCFPKHSFSIVTTFQALRKPLGVYLVSVHNSKGALVWGIKLFGGTVTLEYSEGRRSVAFDVDMPLGKWHRAAFSLNSKQVTLYWNCEKSESKPLPTELSLPLCAKGMMLRLGELGKGYQRHKMELKYEELYFVPHESAAKKQCKKNTFDIYNFTARTTRPMASGYGPDDEESSGSTDETNLVENEASWSEWSPCSHTCGAGKRKRVMMCNLEIDSKPEVKCLKALQTQEIKNCYIQKCPVQCRPSCLNGGTCKPNNQCECRSGYHGDRCQIVACRLRCLNGGACKVPDTCTCPKGYSGTRCEKAMCSPPCRHGGRCISPNRCHCPSGYAPPSCTPICSNPPCMNGGLCTGPSMCLCPKGYTGPRCMKAVCRNRCLNGGVCYAPNTCSCPYGWHGRRCEKARCYPKCQNNGICTRPNVCFCPPGYRGYKCQSQATWRR